MGENDRVLRMDMLARTDAAMCMRLSATPPSTPESLDGPDALFRPFRRT